MQGGKSIRLLLLSLIAGTWGGDFELMAQSKFMSRYRSDEPTRRVVDPSTEILGEVQDGKVRLSERQAVEMALRNNFDINVQRHDPIAVEWQIPRLRSAYDPFGFFNFNWERQTAPTVSVLQGGPSVTDILTVYTQGYRQMFSSGTSLEASFSGVRNRTTNFFSSLVPAINTRFEVLMRQQVLRDFRKVDQEYQIEISRNNIAVSHEEFRRVASETILQVQDAYRELQYALQDIQVKEKSMELARTILEHNRLRFEVGAAARLEVIQADAELALRNEELIRARFDFQQRQDELVRLITSYDDPRQLGAEIVPADSVQPPQDGIDSFERLRALAEELRPEVRQVDLELVSSQVNLDLTRNRLRPGLELVAGYQQFGLGGRQVLRDFSQGFQDPPILAIIPGGLGGSLNQLFSGDFYGYVLGFNLEFPISNSDARAANAEAQIALRRSEMEKKSLLQGISLEIRSALTLIESNRARLEASEAALRLAIERLEGEQARFEVGMGTTRELIEAQRDLLQAETLKLRAEIDLVKSHHQLDRALGRTFERLGIQVADAIRMNVR